ncbi:MAG: hypothetical protein AB1773_10985 [Pseudomonadota bacterium]
MICLHQPANILPATVAALVAAAPCGAEQFRTPDPLKAFVHGEYVLGSDYFVRGRAGTHIFRCALDPRRTGFEGLALSEISMWGNRTGPWKIFRRAADGDFVHEGTRHLDDTRCLESCASDEYFAAGRCSWRRGWPVGQPRQQRWYLMSREGTCFEIGSLKRKVTDLGDIANPDSFVRFMRAKGLDVVARQMPAGAGYAVEVNVPARGLALVFVTSEACRPAGAG